MGVELLKEKPRLQAARKGSGCFSRNRARMTPSEAFRWSGEASLDAGPLSCAAAEFTEAVDRLRWNARPGPEASVSCPGAQVIRGVTGLPRCTEGGGPDIIGTDELTGDPGKEAHDDVVM